jgi:hypothetical protein
MLLIYRGELFNCPARPILPYRQPSALNWRYQVPGETYSDLKPLTIDYQPPRAINWRWQQS